MADTIRPTFDITRRQIAEFAKDPRTIRDIEALARMLRDQVPAALVTKVDDSRHIDTDSTLTGGGDLTTDLTLGVELVSEAERIRDVIGTALTDTATIDFTADDAADTIKADLKNTTVTAGLYGDATHVGQFTVDAQGRLTLAASVAITFPSVSSGGGLLAANNLSDVASASTARTNLGLLRLVAFFFTTAPTASEVLCLYIAADAFTLAANLAGSKVSVGTNPTGTVALDVQRALAASPTSFSSIGTVSISTAGAATLTTASGTSKSIAAGDIIKVVAPASPDATIANVAVTLKGTL